MGELRQLARTQKQAEEALLLAEAERAGDVQAGPKEKPE